MMGCEQRTEEERAEGARARDQQELEDALQFALRAHAGQTDKAGEPYILHPLRMTTKARDHIERVFCLLHDVQEDAPGLVDEVCAHYALNWPGARHILGNLTRRPGECYSDYIERVGRTSLTTRVKILDLQDNLDPERLARLQRRCPMDDQHFVRLQRYVIALARLQNLEENRWDG